MLETSRTTTALAVPTSLRVWRSDLARPSDRAQSVLFAFTVAVWALAVPVMAVLASAAWPDISARVDHSRQGVVAVDAVLVTGTPPPPTRLSMPVDHASLAVWTDRSGDTVTGPVTVPSGSTAGQHIQLWLDQDGAVVPHPLSSTTACALLIMVSLTAWIVLGGLLAGLFGWGRRVLDRGRHRRWDEEWAVVNAAGRPWTR